MIIDINALRFTKQNGISEGLSQESRVEGTSSQDDCNCRRMGYRVRVMTHQGIFDTPDPDLCCMFFGQLSCLPDFC